jgi:hypothetical protein
MGDLKLGRRSTHNCKCVVCSETFGNAQQHDCPYKAYVFEGPLPRRSASNRI